MTHDYVIIGAGPAGLACAIEAEKLGRSCLVLDKGCLANTIYSLPADLIFFSTPDLLQIGELVFISQNFRPARAEVLKYYRAVADHYRLKVSAFEKVTAVVGENGGFTVETLRHNGERRAHKARNVVFATGYYDNPNMLHIHGEGFSAKVSHYYSEAHPYSGMDVAIIGGKNSAVEAALNLYRAGARVTIIHRGPSLSDSVKYWVRPDIEKRLEGGQIKAMFMSEVAEIHPAGIMVRNRSTGEVKGIPNDFVFALTGYHPDVTLLKSCGVEVDQYTLAPLHNPETLETNVPGIYVAGSIVAGLNNNKVFIENSREHGKLIIR
ncbi:MAG: YpdA family putative bacillithiol disulfide reductase [Nitrospinae bacterium]|nr:YpdA family putative bacillithiol disulfide reductase [Nitrospinota bacterium]